MKEKARAQPRALTKPDLCDALFNQLGFSRADARLAVDTVFDELTDALRAGQEVRLTNFGIFELRTRAARPARNPRTGAPVLIPPRTAVVFRQAPALLGEERKEKSDAEV